MREEEERVVEVAEEEEEVEEEVSISRKEWREKVSFPPRKGVETK